MKVLLVGVIEKYMCNDPTRFFEPETEYTTLDADPDVKADYHADIRWSMPDELIGRFEAVFCSHVLEQYRGLYTTANGEDKKAQVDQVYVIGVKRDHSMFATN